MLCHIFLRIARGYALKRVALAVASAATAVVALLPGSIAEASAPGGYTVSRVVLTSRVFGIAEDPSTGLVYVGGPGTVRGEGTVTVIDGASEAVEGSITVPGTPLHIAVDPATDTVYASTASGLTVIDAATSAVITTVPVAPGGGAVAVDPATDTVYTTASTGTAPGIAVINGATNSITTTIALSSTTGAVNSLAVDTATGTIYAGTLGGTLYAIDGATDTVAKSVQLSSPGNITGLAVESASVYAVDDTTNTVDVVNAATLAATASVTGCPYHVIAAAADPVTNAVFVTSYGTASPSAADSTCVIDAATNTVAETFPRGGMAVAADPVTGAAYIAAWNPLTDIWVATPSATDELSPMVYGFGPFVFGSPSETFAVGVRSSYSLLVSALPAATITETGALPAGITMSPSGVFSGTPATGTVGTYPITVSASNGVSPASSVDLTIDVDIAPAITSSASATFQTGVAGSFTVQATGSPAPTVSAVDYPAWMTFTPGSSSGVLSGTPPAGSGGLWQVYISAQNGSGFTASQTLTVTVNQPPAVHAASRLTFRVGGHVRYRITSTGFPVPVLRERGLLPRGLAFRAGANGTALIVGKPARSDKGKRYRVTIIASNNVGNAATEHVTIRIR
jgi:large repetitive protein